MKKLTLRDKQQICKKYYDGKFTISELAISYNRSYSTMRDFLFNYMQDGKYVPIVHPFGSVTEIEGERWKRIRISSTLKYDISDWGRVRRLKKDGKYFYINTMTGHRYAQFVYTDTITFKRIHLYVHLLVAKYFLPKQKGCLIHIDFNNYNNRVDNLKFVSFEEALNRRSPLRHSRKDIYKKQFINGVVKAHTKLTVKDIIKIKKDLPKLSTRELMVKYKISDSQVYRIKTGENWGYINGN